MAPSNQLVVFTLDEEQYALSLACVERIVRAVEITHLPDAPDSVLGVINVEGRVIPVVNSRRLLGVSQREIDLQDLFIIVNDGRRTYALPSDQVKPVIEMPEQQLVASQKMLPGQGYVQGVAKVDEGLIIVLTPEKVLDFDQQYTPVAGIESTQEASHGR